MKPSIRFGLPHGITFWRPDSLRWVMQDLSGTARQPEHDHRTHLRATLEWACRAQDACRNPNDNGLAAAGFDFSTGWLPASTDTTGWLVETLLPAAKYLAWPDLENRARVMLDALLAPAGHASPGRIHGLIAGHVQLGHDESLASAVRSGHELVNASMVSLVQHAQAAHALAALGTLTGEAGLRDAAHRHLETVLLQQTPSGWFSAAAGPVSTLALAAILRSLIEAARLLDDARAWRAAMKAGQGLRNAQHRNGRLAGSVDDNWVPAASYVCVTGLAQLAGCWLRLAQVSQDVTWRDAAWRALAWIKRNQRMKGDAPALRDALPSAVPIWGGPAAFSFNTLNAKHFADALMMDMVGAAVPPMPHMDDK